MLATPSSPSDRIRLAWDRFRRAPRAREKAAFYFHLATLLDAGIPLVQALRNPGASRRTGGVTSLLHAAAHRGEPLAEAMRRDPPLFDRVEIALVQAGETSGKLAENARAIAARLEAEQEDRDAIRAGLRYPTFILHFAIFVLPIPLLVGPGVGGYLASVAGSLAVLYGLAIGVLLLHTAFSGQPRYAAALNALPIAGALRRARGHARFARVFASLHSAGLPFERCLALAAGTSGFEERAGDFQAAGRALRDGRGLPDALALLPFLPADLVAAFSVGEKAGRLEETLDHSASEFERQARLSADRLRKTLSLAIYLLVAAWVGWRIISWYLGYFRMLSAIR